MCDHCTTIESAFGLRDPLPPRIALLDAVPSIPFTNEWACPSICVTHGSAKTELSTRISTGNSLSKTPQSETSTDFKNLSNTEMAASVILSPAPMLVGRDDSSNVKPRACALRSLKHSSTFSSTIPTPSRDANANWPALAASQLQALQRTSGTAAFQHTEPSVLASILEHADILDTLLLNFPDYPTLFAFVISCKTAKRAFEHHPQGIIKAILNTMPQELRHLTVALIGINGSQMETSQSIQRAMKIWLGKGPKPLSEKLQKSPFEILGKLARSFAAIDLFLEVIPKNCESNLADYKEILASREGLNYFDITDCSNQDPLLQQTEWSDVPDDTEWDVQDLPPLGVGPQAFSCPLNDSEMHRLKRALLRYEIFCAIFYMGPDRHYDTQNILHRLRSVPDSCKQRAFCEDQATFLRKYVTPWEIGELAVVSHFMFDLVRNAYFHKYKVLRYAEAYHSWYGKWEYQNHGRNRHCDHEMVVDEFDNHMVWFASQGLTLLHKIYVDRKMGYKALVAKYGVPCYRAAELFVPFKQCAERHRYGVTDSTASWKPRKTWSDTPGMELPSKGWIAKSPASDATRYADDGYWGEKWMRKIGYYIWDREQQDDPSLTFE